MPNKSKFDIISSKTILELYEIAKALNIPSYRKFKKEDLIEVIVSLEEQAKIKPEHHEQKSNDEVHKEHKPRVTHHEQKSNDEVHKENKPRVNHHEQKSNDEVHKEHKPRVNNHEQKSNETHKEHKPRVNHHDGQKPRVNNHEHKSKENQEDQKTRPVNVVNNQAPINSITSDFAIKDPILQNNVPNPVQIPHNQSDKQPLVYVQGILEVLPEGYGFLRIKGYLPSADDVYISQAQVRKFRLMTGHVITGQARVPKETEKYYSIIKIDLINGHFTDDYSHFRDFDDLIPIYPQDVIKLEHADNLENMSVRVIDIFSPIGKGQRGLIVSPPKAGKTTLLKAIANSVSLNNPEIYLIALLIDERPEEVTDFKRSIKGEVVASTFDELPENHVRITELVLEKAKRLVQHGYDVVILLDSITRMSRAYNLIIPPSGRTLSGGLDPNAMHRPKRFFGAARNIEKGGSLTILATALVETGSRMDDVIFEEFKGTGNMELKLDRKLADRRIFPAMDIKQSGTRKEEMLLTKEELRKQLILRRTLDSGDTGEIAEFIIDRLKKSKTNKEFLSSIVDSGS